MVRALEDVFVFVFSAQIITSRLRIMTANLLVALHSSGLFFHIQPFYNGILAVLILYVDKGFWIFSSRCSSFSSDFRSLSNVS